MMRAQATTEQLLIHLAEARDEAAKADERFERQRALIEELQASGADSLNETIALKTLAAERDLYLARIEMILNQLDLGS